MYDFSYMLTNCEDKMISCEDFSWNVFNGNVTVYDHAEGEAYKMSIRSITEAIAQIMIDEDDQDVDYAYSLSVNIVANATHIGMAEFVRSYCEV